jgi:hypothetical protein
MKRFIKEPLVHFLVLGALLFAVYGWLDRDDRAPQTTRQVCVRESDVAWLSDAWSRQWRCLPTQEELRGLVTAYLKEELLVREAREMKLDENDTVIRRRLAQKVEFLVQDTWSPAEPTEDDLRQFFVDNPERFQSDARTSFSQVFFSREKRKNAAADAKAALAKLAYGARAETMGDDFLDTAEFRDADPQTVASQFGLAFAHCVFSLAPGEWSGPIESGFGVHLVRVSESKPGRQREFTAIKAQVLERWREQRQGETNEKYFASLLKKYDVVLDEKVRLLVGQLGLDTGAAQREGDTRP